MSAYQIDYSDPLRPSFSIPAGGLNGPGGSATNSTLRLYGRGALEWGEAVDEDLLRLCENFAAASPPSAAISGQFWVETKLYYHNSAAGATSGWYRWNFNTSAWGLLNGTGVVATSKPSIPSIGQYWYGTDTFEGETLTNVLWGYYSLGRYEPAKWMPRSFMEQGAVPSATTIPTQVMRVRDGNFLTAGNIRGTWSTPNTTSVSENPPNAPAPGMLWYQPSSGVLRVYSSDTTATGLLRWHDVIGPSRTGSTGTVANGPINMKDPNTGTNYAITNLADPVAGTDAVNRAYVDNNVTTGLATKVSKTGDTMTGPLVVNSSVTANTLTVNTTSTFTGLLTASAGASMGNVLNMNNNRIINLAAPVANTDAANAQYVQQQATTIATTIVNNALGGISSPAINPSSTYKAGDVYILSGRIYIAVGAGTGAPPGGNWRQVFPAVYS